MGTRGLLLLVLLWATAAQADLAEVKARGELRHLGIRYANFVTGDGAGFDVELMQRFARELGVKYTLVYTDFPGAMRDLLGKNVVRKGDEVRLEGDAPVRGDVIASGFTMLPWREKVLAYSAPTFPSQVLLVARAESAVRPITGSTDTARDVSETRRLLVGHTVLAMEKTCLDPANYGLREGGAKVTLYTRTTNLNELAPALLNDEAEFTLLDVPDAIIDLQKWAGRIKVIGPVSTEQRLATAFPLSSPELRKAYDAFLARMKADGTWDALVDKYYPGVRLFFPEFFAQHGRPKVRKTP